MFKFSIFLTSNNHLKIVYVLSANHLPLFSFSTSTTLKRFILSIFLENI